MKAIKCEMCGSTDFQKQDGMFVCQHCKTKYSVEEAKKIMVEIDDSKKLPNLYERARKSLEVGDLAHAAEYYKEILDIVPQDWEAYFYSYLGEITSFTNAEAASVLSKLGNTIPPAYDMAIKDCSAEEAASRVNTITLQTVTRILSIVSCGYALIKEYERGSVLTAEGQVKNQLYSQMRPLTQAIVLAGIGALQQLDAKLCTLETVGVDPEVVKTSLLVVRRNKYQIANRTYYANLVCPEKLIKKEFIRRYAQEVIDLGGFGTCKGEETVAFERDKIKAFLMQEGVRKEVGGGGKGKVTVTNYKVTLDAKKKSFEKSLENLYDVGYAIPFIYLYFTDGYTVSIKSMALQPQDALNLKNKIGL